MIFEHFVKLTHPDEKRGWEETTAYFTGEAEQAGVRKTRHYIPADYKEYRIRYYANDKEIFGWYIFYPVPDPDPEEIRDKSIRIRYRKNRPSVFEAIAEL